jgi:antibiotic biosynthesis monooxygenase (ABM) superfamily enzyme
MITRLWRGWTTADNADAYERFLLSELFPSMRAIPGFRDADVLRRLENDEVAFITLTRFDSVAAVGDDYQTPSSNLRRTLSSRATSGERITSIPQRSPPDAHGLTRRRHPERLRALDLAA